MSELTVEQKLRVEMSRAHSLHTEALRDAALQAGVPGAELYDFHDQLVRDGDDLRRQLQRAVPERLSI